MNIYFVRHGESEFNAKHLHQHPHVTLSEQGVKQAAFVAKRFENIPVDIIFSSDSVRAAQTAHIIGNIIQKEVVEHNTLEEIKRPSEVVGHRHDEPEVKAIYNQIHDHFNENWHHSDEENFFDAKKRAQGVISMLNERKEEHILVVTHGVFMKLLIAVLMLGDNVTPELFFEIRDFLATRNTGITWCAREATEERWHLLTWNDHAHLG